MKITGVEVFQVDPRYAGGVYGLSGGRTYFTFDATIARLTTETGHEGWGERPAVILGPQQNLWVRKRDSLAKTPRAPRNQSLSQRQ